MDAMQSVQVAVTDLNGRNMECLGEKVYEIAECLKYKEDSLVIVAVKENSGAFMDMLNCLRKYGFSHIISVSATRLK